MYGLVRSRPLRQEAGRKKLIAFPRPESLPAFLRKHIAEMEKTPFDGTVVGLKYTRPDDSQGDFQWENWSKVAFTEVQLKPALDDLRATPFKRFKHNFLRFNTASRAWVTWASTAMSSISGSVTLSCWGRY